ncbi:MAG: ribosome hibernation-promoting factor, HPF/YfiA family [Alphaproteobacteria bacterium]
MQISVTGKQLDVGASLRTHIDDSLDATVQKYFGSAMDATVVLSRDGRLFRADIAVHVGKGIQVRSHDVADDAYAAFDVSLAHLGKRLRRHKGRLRAHHKSREEAVVEPAQTYVLEAPSEAGESAPEPPVVIAESTSHIELLTVSEAVMRLDLADVAAMVFRNAGSGILNVVYRRADGNIGWVDPGSS